MLKGDLLIKFKLSHTVIWHIVILTLISSLPAHGEYFRHLTLGDGLSQPSVMAISQDKLGRMWFGTREGVNIYDGVGITSYKGWIDSGDENEQVWIGNEVGAIVNDSIGNIFILIDDDIVKYDLATDRFIRLTGTGNIRALAENEGEIAYIAGDSIFIKRHDSDVSSLAFIAPSVKQITHLAFDKNNYYIATHKGLHIFDRKSRSSQILLPDRDIYSSFVARDGTLWITTMNDGLFHYLNDGKEPVVVSTPTPLQGVMGAGQCRHAIEDPNGKIWYGSFSGLFCYDPATGKTRQIMIPMNIGGLTHSSVFGMYCDRKGNLWVGTYYGGVNYFSLDKDKFLNFNYDGFAPANLAHSFVKDMVKDKTGNLWFATDGAGVGCLDENWNIISHLYTDNAEKSLRQNNVRCLEYDSAGNRLFIGTHLGGLSVYDLGKQRVTNLIDEPKYRNALGNVIHKLKIHGNNLFIASRAGLSWMNLTNGDIKKVNAGIYPTMMDIDEDGNIYCTSATARRVYKITKPTSENSEITVIAEFDKKILPTQICSTDNGVLVATLGNGLLYYPNDGTPDFINMSNSRLPDNYCYGVSRGSGDEVFVSTGNDIVKLNMSDHSMQSISFSDLFPESHIINECALISLPNDEVLIGSTKGITRLNSSDFNASSAEENSPRIYFSRLRLHNRDVTAADGTGVLDRALPYSDHITLPSDHNEFSIVIGVSDYLATTGNPTIEYRMDGIDADWIPALHNEVRYRNLPSGKYRLRARQADGKEISIGVTVRTAWYNSWWARLIFAAVVFALGFYIIQKKIIANRLSRSLKKEKSERAQIEKLNQEKFVFFTNVSHEFQTPLTLIISHIDILMSRYKRHPKLTESLMRIRKHSEQMSHLITQLLEFRKLQQNQQILRIGLYNANDILRETAVPFRDYAAKRNINFTISTDDDNPRGAYDPALLKRVLVNILSNAFKYTPDGGKISCAVTTSPTGEVIFEVEDNGRGISENDLPYIFDRFYNGNSDEMRSDTVDYHSTGIGLAFAKSIVDKHHGVIKVRSREGAGSTFNVIIPGTMDVFTNDSNIVFDKLTALPAGVEKGPTEPQPHISGTELTKPDDKIPVDADSRDDATDAAASDCPLLLIVEDNAELRKNLAEFFSAYFRIAEAADGEEGLQKTRELTPDIIISDVMMPRMSGTEMCKIIKADLNLCHIPVILLTALSASESKLEGLNTNADDYVTKPFESDLLLARVDNLLRLRRILRKQFEQQPVNEVDMSIVNPLDRELLKRATEVIEKHLDNLDFDIPMLYREIGVSRSLFFNKFKSLTGMTPNAFILNYRLKHAAMLLKTQPHLSIADVSDKSGFATAIYFSRCFRKQFGVSPLNYRKGMAGQDNPEDADGGC